MYARRNGVPLDALLQVLTRCPEGLLTIPCVNCACKQGNGICPVLAAAGAGALFGGAAILGIQGHHSPGYQARKHRLYSGRAAESGGCVGLC